MDRHMFSQKQDKLLLLCLKRIFSNKLYWLRPIRRLKVHMSTFARTHRSNLSQQKYFIYLISFKRARFHEEQIVLLDALKLFLSVAKVTYVVAQTRCATEFECSSNSERNESGARRFDHLRKYNLCKWFQRRLDAIGIRKDAIAARPTQSFGFLIQFVGASVTGINRYRQVFRGPAKSYRLFNRIEKLSNIFRSIL